METAPKYKTKLPKRSQVTQHELKLEAEFFQLKIKGKKSWELRNNDREFKAGDLVTFLEVSEGVKTGRKIRVAKIQNVFHGGKYGLAEGFVIFQHTNGLIDC